MATNNHDEQETPFLRSSHLAGAAKVGHQVMPSLSSAGGAYGERLVPQVLDALASSDPERIYASIPLTPDVNDGFRDVTMQDLANAVNNIAWMLEGIEGKPEEGRFERIAYIGASDIRYAIMMIAAIKVGYVALLPSARNSTSGNISLLNETKCTKVFYSTDMTGKVKEWKSEKPELELYSVDGLYALLDKSPSKHYPYDKKFADAIKDPALICHTSGSTSAPKPITLRAGTWAVLDNHRKLPLVEGRRNMDYSCYKFDDNGRFICTFPPFHVAGMHSQIVMPILYNATLVLFPPEKPATGEITSAIMSQMRVRGIFCPPAVLEQLVRVPGGLEQAAGLDFAMYSGGPLAPFAGEQLSEVTDLTQVYGQTETGIIPALFPRREHWAYFEWNPAYKVDMQHHEDDIYEQVLHQDEDLSWIRTFYHTFPEIKEWRTKDLFKRHPDHLELWQYKGRTDDILVLSNGEKMNPVGMEEIIYSHPAVNGALIAGHRKFQTSLIIEPKIHPEDADALIDDIWPIVQKANLDGPAHGRIFRSKITLSNPDKPFLRAGKGTIIRQKTTDLYADEIEALYSASSNQKMREVPHLENPQDLIALKQFLKTYLGHLLPDGAKVETEDLFNIGLDSLQTMELTNALRAVLKPHLGPAYPRLINTKLIYANPTLDTLSAALSSRLRGNPSEEDKSVDAEAKRKTRMKDLVGKHTEGLPQRRPRPKAAANRTSILGRIRAMFDSLLDDYSDSLNQNEHQEVTVNKMSGHTGKGYYHHIEDISRANGSARPNDNSRGGGSFGLNIILTGSTGSLGTQLLQALIQSPQVSHVHCLNRSTDAQLRHLKDFQSRGVNFDLKHVSFHTASFGAFQLGLSTATYRDLEATVDVIIHNAWKVDFNHTVDSYEEVHIKGVRRFIDLCIEGAKRPKLTFVSSISSVANWVAYHPDHPMVTEQPLKEYGVAQKFGYGESKHISERMLAIAAEQSGVIADILRVGQIGGPLTANGGKWNTTEWMPTMIKTSKAMGCVPDKVMEVDWIPVDVLANIILEITRADKQGLRIYNLVNPHVVEWSSLIPAIVEHFPSIQVVPLEEWVERLGHVNADDENEVAAKPAVKILDWFVELEKALTSTHPRQRYETGHGVAVSPTMASLPIVSVEWMKIWLEQWAF